MYRFKQSLASSVSSLDFLFARHVLSLEGASPLRTVVIGTRSADATLRSWACATWVRARRRRRFANCANPWENRPADVSCCWIPEEMVARLNRRLRGWANYFCLGPVSRGLSRRRSLRHDTGSAGGCARSTRCRGTGTSRFPDEYLYQQSGTDPAAEADPQPPVGESMRTSKPILVREPDAGNPPVRFDERDVETDPFRAAPRLY